MLHLTSAKKPGDDNLDYNSGYESCSSSEVDSLTEDLDQIGRFNLPKLTNYLSKEGFPSLPAFPNLPNLSALPNLPNLPNFNHLPNLPNLPNLPQLPTFPNLRAPPNLPSFDLTEISRYVAQYVQKDEAATDNAEAQTRLAYSVRTALATRIQMNTFLSDLKGGLSFQAAIDRLQPLTDIVHEAVSLPVDDISEDEVAINDTEPVGVGEIVNREQAILTEPVLPETGRVSAAKATKHKHKHKHSMPRVMSGMSDGYDSSVFTGSDVEELTAEEARALTHLDSLDDFFKEEMLRKKIQKIQALDNLSQQLKNKLVTKLMMGNYYRYINEKLGREKGITLRKAGGLVLEPKNDDDNIDRMLMDESDEHMREENDINDDEGDEIDDEIDEDEDDEVDEVMLTEEDQRPSYYDKAKSILGCPHYQRNCKIECPTCLKWFPCRFCHDQQVADHKLQRSEVRHVLCMRCNTPQFPESAYCVNCEEELANYFCAKCVLYDNDPAKDIYHCDKCGICRLGLGIDKDYFHCDVCNICLLIDLKEHHKCVTNTTHCNCPICNEYLFTSVSKVVFMKCGHLIHQNCYDEMINHSYKCPVCKKTVVNAEIQFRILDQEIRQLPLPAPYNLWRCIISCNDCKGKSNCSYHVMGLKCKYCKSYNTNQLKLIKPEENDDDDLDYDANEANERITLLRLMKTNLGSNFLIEEQNDSTEPHGKSARTSVNLEEQGNLANFRRLTKALLGDKEIDRRYVTKMFQNFVNSTVEERDLDSAKSEMEIFGGF